MENVEIVKKDGSYALLQAKLSIIRYNGFYVCKIWRRKMKKLFSIVIAFLVTILLSMQAFAHSYLSGSNPTNGEVKTEQVQEITLHFDGKIMEGSFLDITTVDGDPIEVTSIEIGDGYLTGKVAEPLTNNEYKVNWSIISADGHPLEGNFSFTVNAPIVIEPPEEANEEQQSESNSLGEDNISNEIAQVDKDGSKPLIFVVLAIAAIVLLASTAFAVKRKK